jgi:parallel beta-helix repeat protein
MKRLLVMLLTVLLALAAFVPIPIAAATTLHVDDDGVQWPGAYNTVADALAVASTGDNIIVHEGVYAENVAVTISVTIQAAGEKTRPVIDGGFTNSAFLITANGVVVKGFDVRSMSEAVIEVLEADNVLIINNKVTGSESRGNKGIYLNNANNNQVLKNIIAGPTYHGILAEESTGNLIKKNKLTNNGWSGILLFYANDNRVLENKVIGSVTRGIRSWYSTNNVIKENKLSGWIHGIELVGSSDNLIKENNVYDSREGIRLSYSNDNLIIENEVKKSINVGIEIRTSTSSDNLIKENKVFGSGTYDLYWDGSSLGNSWEDNKYKTSFPDPLP